MWLQIVLEVLVGPFGRLQREPAGQVAPDERATHGVRVQAIGRAPVLHHAGFSNVVQQLLRHRRRLFRLGRARRSVAKQQVIGQFPLVPPEQRDGCDYSLWARRSSRGRRRVSAPETDRGATSEPRAAAREACGWLVAGRGGGSDARSWPRQETFRRARPTGDRRRRSLPVADQTRTVTGGGCTREPLRREARGITNKQTGGTRNTPMGCVSLPSGRRPTIRTSLAGRDCDVLRVPQKGLRVFDRLAMDSATVLSGPPVRRAVLHGAYPALRPSTACRSDHQSARADRSHAVHHRMRHRTRLRPG